MDVTPQTSDDGVVKRINLGSPMPIEGTNEPGNAEMRLPHLNGHATGTEPATKELRNQIGVPTTSQQPVSTSDGDGSSSLDLVADTRFSRLVSPNPSRSCTEPNKLAGRVMDRTNRKQKRIRSKLLSYVVGGLSVTPNLQRD